jgi:hypothetical protein
MGIAAAFYGGAPDDSQSCALDRLESLQQCLVFFQGPLTLSCVTLGEDSCIIVGKQADNAPAPRFFTSDFIFFLLAPAATFASTAACAFVTSSCFAATSSARGVRECQCTHTKLLHGRRRLLSRFFTLRSVTSPPPTATQLLELHPVPGPVCPLAARLQRCLHCQR